VEDKEQKLEKKIDRQAAKIERGDRGVDMEGLDKKHRVMLRVGAPHHACPLVLRSQNDPILNSHSHIDPA
jgi:hypothetical protein